MLVPAAGLPVGFIRAVAWLAQAAAVLGVVGIEACVDQLPPVERVVVGDHGWRTVAEDTDRVAVEDVGAELVAVVLAVAALRCGASSLVGGGSLPGEAYAAFAAAWGGLAAAACGGATAGRPSRHVRARSLGARAGAQCEKFQGLAFGFGCVL